MPSSAAIAAACIGPAPPKGSSAKRARVDAALDGDHAQRPDHLLVGDPDDPLGGLELAEAERAGELRDRRPAAASASSSTPPASRESAARLPSSRLASVTVGSVPPRP